MEGQWFFIGMRCVVCLDGPLVSPPVVLGCGHELCAGCLSELEAKSARLGLSQTCPVCRAPLPRVAAAEARGLDIAARAMSTRPPSRELLLGAVVTLRSVVDSTKGQRCDRAACALGTCLAELGQARKAAEVFRRSQTDEARLALALIEGKGLEEVYANTPRGSWTKFEAAMEMSFAARQSSERVAFAKASVDVSPDDESSKARAAVRLGDLFLSQGFVDEAEEAYASAPPVSPSTSCVSDDSDYSSSSSEDENDPPSPRDVKMRARDERYHDRASAWLKLGVSRWRRSGSTPQSRGLVRRAARGARLDSVRCQASLYLGLAQLDNRSYRRAARSLRRVVSSRPRSVLSLALTKLGEAYLALGELGRAERSLREALEIEPDRVAALLRLADVLTAVEAISGGPWRKHEAARLVKKAKAHMARRRIATLVVTHGEIFFTQNPSVRRDMSPSAWLPTSQANNASSDDVFLYEDDDDDYSLPQKLAPPKEKQLSAANPSPSPHAASAQSVENSTSLSREARAHIASAIRRSSPYAIPVVCSQAPSLSLARSPLK